MGRFTRTDGRKSSNYCLSISIIVVVSACLIGTWIMMSSLADSAGYFRMSVGLRKDFKLKIVSRNNSRQFEDNSGDLPKDGRKGNANQTSERDDNPQGNQNIFQEFESLGELGVEKKLEKVSSDDDERIASDKRYVEFRKDKSTKHMEEISVSIFGNNETTPRGQQKVEKKNDGSKLKTDEGEEKSWAEVSDSLKDKIDELNDEANNRSLEQASVSPNVSKVASKRTRSISKDQAELLNYISTQIDAWLTQAAESKKQKDSENYSLSKEHKAYRWKICNVTAGPDYIPCLDNIQAIGKLPSTSRYEHRERHCPDEAPTCLVHLPKGYRTSLKWPKSRERIWLANVPHTKLVEVKGHQNWIQLSGSYVTFPGGGTQFKNGAKHYIDFIQKTVPDIAWGKRSRVILDVGCGVASFGGYLFDREVLTMSLAPKDKHEAQVQFALERGIPAILAVMGTKRLPFPTMAFDVVHCARCRVPWHVEGGKLLLELDRVLRPGGYFVWSATPLYRKDPEDVSIWKAMSRVTKSMCWELVKIGKDKSNGVSVAVYQKPTSNDCYKSRTKDDPPTCQESDYTNAVWNIPLKACIHKVPTDPSERKYQLPVKWPLRLEKPPYWLRASEPVVYGKPAPKDFIDDYNHWKHVVKSYLDDIGIDWSTVRNVMDMRAIYGGFAAALKDLKLWVMNVVPVSSSDTLLIIYERGLFGLYHDWCESFSTYPRSYDLLHADHLFSDLKKRCNSVALMAEVDRILRPGGSLIVRDDAETVADVELMAKSLQWKTRFTLSKDNEGLLCVQKTRWRPSDVQTITSAIV